MIIVVKVLYILIAIYFLLTHYKKYSITPSLIFIAMQLVMFLGIITAPDALEKYGEHLILIYFSSLIFFIFGIHSVKSQIAINNKNSSLLSKHINNDNLSNYQKQMIYFLIIVSILFCFYFYMSAGVNLFIESLIDFINGRINVYRNERLSFFSISGVGYIYQFRTIILPVLNIFLVIGQRRKYTRIGLTILPLTLIFILGTGQRNAFVFFLLFIFFYIKLLGNNLNIQINKKYLVIFYSLSLLFLIILTISNGRVNSENNSQVNGAIQSLADRTFGVNSKTALFAFKYIETQPTVWGYDWLMMLADILPGKSGYLSVDRIVNYLAYGTYDGTGPPCIWGSAWYNWSIFGATLFPFILGILYQNVYIAFSRIVNSKLSILIYAALCTYMGIWFCGSPMVLFNNGVITLLIMNLLLMKLDIKKGKIFLKK